MGRSVLRPYMTLPQRDWRLIFADVFVPDVGFFGDEFLEEVDAVLGMEIDHADAVFDEPVEAAAEADGFTDDDSSDLELADEAAAIPAGGEGGDHDFVAVGALAAGFAEGVGFTVDAGVGLLDAAVAASGEQGAGAVEESCSDGDAAFAQAEAGFVDGDAEHGAALVEVGLGGVGGLCRVAGAHGRFLAGAAFGERYCRKVRLKERAGAGRSAVLRITSHKVWIAHHNRRPVI